MNRHEAAATIAVWRELLADPADRPLYGRAVLALAAAAEHFEAECARIEAISRLDVTHLAELGKTIRDLKQMLPIEHIERDPVVPMVRPPATGTPPEPVLLPRLVS